MVHHEGDGRRLFHSTTLSVTTRRSSQIHPSLSAQRATNPRGRGAGSGTVSRAEPSRQPCRTASASARPARRVGGFCGKLHPSRLRLRRRASATVARGRGRQGLVHEAPATKRFGRLEGAVTATTQMSPRNYPGSCSQHEPKRPKGDDVGSADFRGFLCGGLAPVVIRKGLITQRSLVQIQPPQPTKSKGYGRRP